MARSDAAARRGGPAWGAPLLGLGMQWALTRTEGAGSLFAGYAAAGGRLAALASWGPVVLPAVSIPVFLAILLLDRGASPLSGSRALRRAVGAGGAAGAALLFLAPWLGRAALPAAALGCLLAGVCSSLLLIMWSEVYSALPGRSIAEQVGLSVGLGAAVSLACSAAPGPVCAAACAALSLASAGLVPRAAEASGAARPRPPAAAPAAGTSARRGRLGPFARLLLGLAVFGAAFGLFPSLLSAGGPGGPAAARPGQALALAAVAATGLAVAAVARCASGISTRRLFNLVLPVTAAALLIASLLGKESGAWAYAVMSAGETILDVVIWMALSDTAARTGRPATFVFSAGRLAAHVGRTAGQLAGGAAVASLGGAGSVALVTACCAIMYALILTSSFMMGDRDAAGWGPEGPGAPADAGEKGARASQGPGLDERCRALAEANGLSPRELQVLLLLARGRSVPFIQEELHIAESTAKTHSHRVYEKLGVHTKQELLDLVEGHGDPADRL